MYTAVSLKNTRCTARNFDHCWDLSLISMKLNLSKDLPLGGFKEHFVALRVNRAPHSSPQIFMASFPTSPHIGPRGL